MKRFLIVCVIWFTILGLGAAVARYWFFPKKAEEKRIETVTKTGSDGKIKTTVKLSLDSFSGYALFRSEDFQNELAKEGIKLEIIDDSADYNSRLRSLKDGTTQMALFPIDALIKSSANIKETPATIVALIDETKGADAALGYETLFPNIDSLNRPDLKFVCTQDSPSETLARVIIANFNLNSINNDSWVYTKSAEEVYQKYKDSKPNDPYVYVLWEPFVSKIKENSKTHILMDSSKFRGYIVDALVTDRDFLIKNDEVVKKFVKAYFRSLFNNKDKMADIVIEDSVKQGHKLNKEQAEKIVSGIWWKNTQENYAHLLGGNLQQLELMLSNITSVLLKTKALSADPVNSQYNAWYYDKLLLELQQANFYPGWNSGSEEVRQDTKIAALTDAEWNKIVQVGTLQIESIVFPRGTSILTGSGEEILDGLIQTLQSWPQCYLLVSGNSANVGDPEANKVLAQQRAEKVQSYLTEKGIDPHRIKAIVGKPNGTTVSFVLGSLPY